jgi:hypothetical protein
LPTIITITAIVFGTITIGNGFAGESVWFLKLQELALYARLKRHQIKIERSLV